LLLLLNINQQLKRIFESTNATNFSDVREDKVKSLGHNESGGVQKLEN